MATAAASIDHEEDHPARKFEDTKQGVKGLVDSGITRIPHFFIHPQQALNDLDQIKLTHDYVYEIPTIDLFGIERSKVVEQVACASRELGLFQVNNHGIPLEVLDRTLGAIRAFHDQPAEMKEAIYRRKMGLGVSYFADCDLLCAKAASWRDTLQIIPGPIPQVVDEIPEICRNEIIEWDGQIKRVAEFLVGLLCEGLGLDEGKLKDVLEVWATLGHCYPYCPQPNLTFGNVSHTDASIVTLLLQDHIGGLQVKYNGEWVDVKPTPGALVVNLGNLLQIMSNDEYKSPEHRVLANPCRKSRVSIAIFFKPMNEDSLYGPFPELISPDKPAVYGQFIVSDFVIRFLTKNYGNSKSLLDYYKI